MITMSPARIYYILLVTASRDIAATQVLHYICKSWCRWRHTHTHTQVGDWHRSNEHDDDELTAALCLHAHNILISPRPLLSAIWQSRALCVSFVHVIIIKTHKLYTPKVSVCVCMCVSVSAFMVRHVEVQYRIWVHICCLDAQSRCVNVNWMALAEQVLNSTAEASFSLAPAFRSTIPFTWHIWI